MMTLLLWVDVFVYECICLSEEVRREVEKKNPTDAHTHTHTYIYSLLLHTQTNYCNTARPSC